MYNNTNYRIKTNSELRTMARDQLNGNWGTAILICFIFSVLTGIIGSIPYIGWIGSLVLSGPLTFGLAKFFICRVRLWPSNVETLFDGFKLFESTFLLYLLMRLFTFLWSLLLIIPGIIAHYSYSLSLYILNDNPNLSAMDALRQSKEMMRGYKEKLFLLHLSFIGWGLLCIPTLGIGFLWLVPYIQMSTANFYEDIRTEWENNRNNSQYNNDYNNNNNNYNGDNNIM